MPKPSSDPKVPVPRALDPRVRRILALLVPLGPVEVRRMFGGYGFYLEGTIFGLLFDGAFFLKADGETQEDFERLGLGPLTYEGGRGQEIALPYWQAPKSLLKDGAAMCRWAQKAYQAGLRFEARKKPKAGKRAADGRSGVDAKSARRGTKPLKPGRGPRYDPDF
jgi:DNA transformation protein and related proteins